MSDQDQQSSKGGSNSDIKKVSEGKSPRYRLDMDEKKQLYNVKVIWVIGVPGSGKSTQLKKIAEKYNCTVIDAGDLMRKEISKNTELGKEIKTALEEDRKPSIEIVLDLALKATKMALSEKNDYIFFDGVSGESSKVDLFEEYIKPCDLILNLEIDNSMTRIQQRAKIDGRIEDQDMKRVENRLAEYQKNIGGFLKEIRDRNYRYAEIDADKSEDEVFKDICNEIEKLKENISRKEDIDDIHRSFSKTVEEKMEKVGADMKQGLENISKSIKEIIEPPITEVASGMKEGLDHTGEELTKFGQTIEEKLKKFGQNVDEKMDEAKTEIKQGLEEVAKFHDDVIVQPINEAVKNYQECIKECNDDVSKCKDKFMCKDKCMYKDRCLCKDNCDNGPKITIQTTGGAKLKDQFEVEYNNGVKLEYECKVVYNDEGYLDYECKQVKNDGVKIEEDNEEKSNDGDKLEDEQKEECDEGSNLSK